MSKRIISMLFFVLFLKSNLFSQQVTFKEKQNSSIDKELWVGLMKHATAFFNKHAYDEASKTYLSEIGSKGEIKSRKVHVLALSRMVYALAESSRYFPENLQKAKDAAKFIISKMIKSDLQGPYFVATYNLNQGAETQSKLAVAEQAYGLCGLVALYSVTKDPVLLEKIRELQTSFHNRFGGPGEFNGYHDWYDLKTKTISNTKSYNSTVYVATSFSIALMESDKGNSKYQSILKTLTKAVATHFWDEKTRSIHEKFTADWQVKKSSDLGNTGHNMQAAWLLLRASEWSFISQENKTTYQQIAVKILKSMLDKPVFDTKYHGVFETFNKTDDTRSLNNYKSWWQQAETIMAFQLAQNLNLIDSRITKQTIRETIHFFFSNFIDTKNGGAYFNVTRAGEPIKGESKGSKGKSAYHSVELAKYMIIYTNK